ncbi:MAG TPA: haloacid dehalogenase type II [Trebonia sp.]|nr:haloacid dehalogenase type II [Trebonia sp.]
MTFRSPSTGQPVRAVLFDVFGTVVDWRSGIAAAAGAFAAEHRLDLDPGAFADAWRRQYQPAMERVRAGERPFVTLDVLHRENLDHVLRGIGLDPAAFPPADLDDLTRAWHFLPPWPDSVPGLTELKRGYIIGPLSNGNTALLLDMAKTAGLPWDLILGSDVSRAFKPSPSAYLHPAGLLGLAPGEVMLAAAHESDLAAARAAGLATGYVHRPLEFGPDANPAAPGGGWDVAGDSISAVAVQL